MLVVNGCCFGLIWFLDSHDSVLDFFFIHSFFLPLHLRVKNTSLLSGAIHEADIWMDCWLRTLSLSLLQEFFVRSILHKMEWKFRRHFFFTICCCRVFLCVCFVVFGKKVYKRMDMPDDTIWFAHFFRIYTLSFGGKGNYSIHISTIFRLWMPVFFLHSLKRKREKEKKCIKRRLTPILCGVSFSRHDFTYSMHILSFCLLFGMNERVRETDTDPPPYICVYMCKHSFNIFLVLFLEFYFYFFLPFVFVFIFDGVRSTLASLAQTSLFEYTECIIVFFMG